MRPEDDEFWSLQHLGYLYYCRERFEKARAIFEGLTALRSDEAYPWYALGLIARRQGHLDRALDYLRHASQLSGRRPEMVVTLGEALIQAGQRDAARDCLAPLARSGRRSPHHRRASALMRRWFGQ